jgi:type IV pilus assembly protein PilO
VKLKLTNREKSLLMITVICLVAALLYYAGIKPQLDTLSELEKKAIGYRQMIDSIKAKASLDNHVYNEYKALNNKTQGLLRNYYPSIIQEKIILMIDEKIKETAIGLVSVTFTEPALTDINMMEKEKSTQENELEDLVKQLYNARNADKKEQSNKETKDETYKVEKMTVSLTLEGSYNQIYNLLKEIEQENRSIICSEINITSNNSNILNCDVKLDFYSVPKPFDQDHDYFNWELTGEYGKDSPF